MSLRISFVVLSVLLLFCLSLQFTNANNIDTFRPGQSLNTTDLISSANGEFSLSFREMRDGISLCVVREISDEHVWVANREHPFVSSAAVLTFNREGNLVISDGEWSHKVTNISAGNDTYAKLLDSGNLILTNKASVVLWQSFDYPSLMLLPGMKLKDAKTGWSFAPSKSIRDPAPGPFSLHLGSRKELILMNGSEAYWSSPIVDELAAIFVIDGEDVTWPCDSTNTNRDIELEEDGSLTLRLLYTGDEYRYHYPLSKSTNDNNTDTFRPGQSLNTMDLISSANGEFSLRFREMRDGISLCVVRELSQEHVWIANREHPFVSSSAVLTFNREGNLVISDGESSRKVTNISAGNDTYAKLLDSGNLILTNKAFVVLWQSFDYPSLMLLPGMKLKDAKTGWSFAPSKSNQDPAPGPFSLHLGPRKELTLMNGKEPYWSSPIVDDLAAIFVIDGEDVTWPRNSTNTNRDIEFEVDGSLNLWWYSRNGYWNQNPLSTFTNANNTDTFRPGQSLNTTDLIFSAHGEFSLRFKEMRDGIILCVVREFIHEHVWIANREQPFVNSSAVLTFNREGNLVISDGESSRKVTNISAGNDTYAKLLDSGNLILTNKASVVLWQSFDYPSLMLLPGMKLKDAKTGWSFTPSKSIRDPAPGPFSLHLGSRKELILMNGSEAYWSSPIVDELAAIFVIDGEDVTWPLNSTNTAREIEFEEDGSLSNWLYTEDETWDKTILSKCAGNGLCDDFNMCNETTDPPCDCLPGFKSENGKCVRKNKLQCSDNTNVQQASFLGISRVVLPTNPQLLHVDNTSDCKSACLRNCSCTGYAYDQEGRCLVYYDTLVNLKQLSSDIVYQTDFYLKLAPQDVPKEFKNSKPGGNNKIQRSAIPIASIVAAAIVGLFIGTCLFVYHARRKLQRKGENLLLLDLGMTQKANTADHGDRGKRDVQMPLFSFASICAATNNFSAANKLGEGGFGPVYKGTLLKGDEVAIKRLSKKSKQGWQELKNEAMLIAKLQHKNLVKLLGCCIEQDEKILVYEYLSNKSLDFFIFDAEKRRILDWETRAQIVEGIAQGLAYLHLYSRLKIIHRDLKPSNILLDINMNPKISDFGLARIFGENELQANTNTIVGTHGYMPPEYIFEGLCSIKFDVFSFGILLLEIVTGKKNTGFYQTRFLHLIRYAWEFWTNDNGADLVDPLLATTPSIHVILRYVNIALLCIQESSEDRPTMSDVVTMLGNENIALPYPKEPAFLNMRSMRKKNLVDTTKPENCSINAVTVSIMEGR